MSSPNFSLKEVGEELRETSFFTVRCDLLSGLQVALLSLPQSMAYALMVGLPLSAGIFAATFSTLVAIFFSSSRFLIGGPVNTISIMLQTSVADILYNYFNNATPDERQWGAMLIVAQIGFLVAIFQILASLFKLGKLTQFVSQPVVRGYMAGSMFVVIASQLFLFTGMPKDYGGVTLYLKVKAFLSHIHLIHWPTFITGIFSLTSLVLLKNVDKRVPAGLITLLLTTSVIYFFNHVTQSDWFADVPLMGQGMAITTLIPTVEFPDVDFSMINQLVPISFAIALLGIVESTCAAKMMSTMTGQPISTNREILSVGLGNLTSSFIGALPIALSPLRSTINLISGAKTRLSGFFCTLFLALLVSLFAFIVNLIPLTALSAMILMTAGYLVHVRETLVCLKATPQDRFVLIATFLACIFFSLDVAFYIGVVLSITTYLRKAAEPQLQEYRVQDTGELYSLRASAEAESKVIRVIKVEGELFFGATHVFESSLKSFARDHKSTKVIILQLKNARDIDASTCVTLLDLADSLKAAGCHLLIAGITPPIWEVLSISGVVEALGKENLFLFDDSNPHYYMKKALQRAKSLTQIEESSKEVILEPEPLTLLDPVS